MARRVKWLTLFEQFTADLRIKSKEIVSSDPRGAPLVLWDSQRRFLREVGDGLDKGVHKFNCCKSRQLGITTVSLAIDVFWLAMHDNVIGCLVTDTEKNRDANRSLIEAYVESFPEGYFGTDFRITVSNRKQIAFSNGCRLDLLIAGTKKKSTSWGEGVGYMFCHATELASYADAEGLKSLEEGFAQENPHRLFIFESTAKGFNHWRERWYAGLDNPDSERSFFIGWWAQNTNRIERSDLRYRRFNYPVVGEEHARIRAVAELYGHRITAEQLAWIRWKEHAAGAETDLLSQNQPWTAQDAFVKTGYSFFQVKRISQDMRELAETERQGKLYYRGYRYQVHGDFYSFAMEEIPPHPENRPLVELKIWEEPVEGGRYVIGMDPAYGRNEHKDRHAIGVFRCFADQMVQVAEYATHEVEAKHAAWVLFHLCGAYGDVMANVELGGPGRLIMMEFDHLRQLLGAEMNEARTKQRGWEDAGSRARWFLYHKVDQPGPGYVHNFEMSWKTKDELLHGFRGGYVSREVVIRSRMLLEEMTNVVVRDGIIGAPESSDETQKDDLVFMAALAHRAWTDWIRKEMLALGQTRAVVERLESEQVTTGEKVVSGIVQRFLAQAAAEKEPERGPGWMVDRGLV